MKKLIKSLSLALSTICLTMTTAFAAYELPTFSNPKQFMDLDFTFKFASGVEAYYDDQCNIEECTLYEHRLSTTGSHYTAKYNIKHLIIDLQKKNPEAALRLVMMLCRFFPHKGDIVLEKPEMYEPDFAINTLDIKKPYEPLYLGLRRRGVHTGKVLVIATIE